MACGARRWWWPSRAAAVALTGGASVGGCGLAYVQWETSRCRAAIDAAAATNWGQPTAQPQRQQQRRQLLLQLAALDRRLAAVEKSLGSAPAGGGVQRRGRSAAFGAARVTVATQNIMDGCLLLPLIDEFERAGIARAVDVLCVQENVLTPENRVGVGSSTASNNHHAARIAAAMRRQSSGGRQFDQTLPGQQQPPQQRRFVCHRCEDAPRLCTVYDANRLRLESSCLISLPLLDPVPWYSRLVFKSVAERKHALVTVFSLCENSTEDVCGLSGTLDIEIDEFDEASITTVGPLGASAPPRQSQKQRVVVVNLHLDAMGDNVHRAKQVREIATQLAQLGLCRAPPSSQQTLASGIGFVACGDSNIFDVGRVSQRQALAKAFEPLTVLGARLCEEKETREADHSAASTTGSSQAMDCPACLRRMGDMHFFARAYEPKFPQQVAVAAGRLGVEIPGLFDIVATDLPVLARHHWQIMSSDHDCVGATLVVGGKAA